MKRLLIHLGIASVFAILLGSCNIKAPIEEILPEGNKSVAPIILISNKVDTISIKNYLPQIGVFDSITSKTVKAKPLRNQSDRFTITLSNKALPLHEIMIWKNGLKSSLIVVKQPTTKSKIESIKMEMRSFLNNVIFVSGAENAAQMIVVWQNTPLPDRFISKDKKGISIFIPKEAKQLSQSTLRVFAANKQEGTGVLTIHLTNGEPHINH